MAKLLKLRKGLGKIKGLDVAVLNANVVHRFIIEGIIDGIKQIKDKNLDPKTLKLSHDTKWVQDFRGNNLLIFTSEWAIRWVLEDNPGLELTEFSKGEGEIREI